MKVVNNKTKEVNKDWKSFTKDSQWEVYFKEIMPKNETLLKRGLLIVYNNQTADEQVTEHVNCKNGQGFSKPDSKILTILAKKLEQNFPLSKNELDILRTKLPKYWRQLMNEAKARNN